MKSFIKTAACIAAVSAMLIQSAVYAAPVPEASEAPVLSDTSGDESDVLSDGDVSAEADIAAEPDDDTDSSDNLPSDDGVTETAEPAETAAPEITPAPRSGAPTASTLDFKVMIDDKKYVIDSFIKIEVYDKNGVLAGTDREWIGGITESVDLHYDVPEYELGDTFTVKLVEGVDTLKYYDTAIRPGESFEVETSWYTDDSGKAAAYNSYIFSAVPLWEKEVFVYVGGDMLKLPSRAKIVDGSTIVPARAVAEAMGISVYYDKDYDSVVCSVGDKQIIYNLGSAYATFFGEDLYLPVAAQYYAGNTYIPVRSLADAFEAPIESKDFGDHLDIIIGESEIVRQSEPVNQWNISSRTNYMVWVSKSEYTVRVYEGSKNKWRKIYTAPCAIGAPGTPTITGSFEYIERTFWDYGSYYVGPVLRFHNGYALHSVLLYYGGGEYDGRVGVRISHGCVRLKAKDINWIANTIPIRTRIYITE